MVIKKIVAILLLIIIPYIVMADNIIPDFEEHSIPILNEELRYIRKMIRGVGDGGTGKSSWTLYAIPYASSTTALGEIAIGTANQILSTTGTGYAWVNHDLDTACDIGASTDQILTTGGFTTSGDLYCTDLYATDATFTGTAKMQNFTLAVGSDELTYAIVERSWSNNNYDAFMRWDITNPDGNPAIVYFQTSEFNATTGLLVQGNNTGDGKLMVYDGTGGGNYFQFLVDFGKVQMDFGSSIAEMVINEDSNSADYRFETDNETHAFYMNANASGTEDRAHFFGTTGDYSVNVNGALWVSDDVRVTDALIMGDSTTSAGNFTMKMGGETGDPQFDISISADANGDVSLTPDTGDLIISLPTAGTAMVSSSSTTVSAMLVDANGTSGTSTKAGLVVDSENPDVATVLIYSANDATGNNVILDDYAFVVYEESLGGAAHFYRDAVGSGSPLVRIKDDHQDTTQATLQVVCDSDASTNAPCVDIDTTNAAFDKPALDVTQAGTGATAEMGDGTNYTQIGSDGTITLVGTARVNKEFRVSLTDFNPGASGPTKALNGIYATYEFTINDDMHTSFEMPHDWAVGTDITIEVYWAIDEAYVTNSGEVQWSADWRAVAVGELITGGTSGILDYGDVNIPAVANTVVKTEATISGGSLALDDLVAFNGCRVALDGGSNPSAEPYIIDVRVEYISDKLGESL